MIIILNEIVAHIRCRWYYVKYWFLKIFNPKKLNEPCESKGETLPEIEDLLEKIRNGERIDKE